MASYEQPRDPEAPLATLTDLKPMQTDHPAEIPEVAKVSDAQLECPEDEHPLQTAWTIFWYNKRRQLPAFDPDKFEKANSNQQPEQHNNNDANNDKQHDEDGKNEQDDSSNQDPRPLRHRQLSSASQSTDVDAQGDETQKIEWYIKNLHPLGTFNSVEAFWSHYSHLRRPSHIKNGYNISVFRANLVPAWETFPRGGCWIIRVSTNEKFLDRLWEELLMSVVGENFKTPDLVGVNLSIRRDMANITVWNRDNTSSDVRFRIGERLKELLNLDEESTVEYKFFYQSLKDKSTTRNATPYTYTQVE